VVAACGSSSNATKSVDGAAAGEGAPPPALQQARVKAAVCVRAQGIDIPDPTATRAGVLAIVSALAKYPSGKVQAAEQACAPEIRKAFPNVAALSPAQRAQRVRAATVFAQCMRAHGVNFPDPSGAVGNPGGFLAALQAMPTNSPAFKAATPVCRAQVLKLNSG
jgi:hypothetical protein